MASEAPHASLPFCCRLGVLAPHRPVVVRHRHRPCGVVAGSGPSSASPAGDAGAPALASSPASCPARTVSPSVNRPMPRPPALCRAAADGPARRLSRHASMNQERELSSHRSDRADAMKSSVESVDQKRAVAAEQMTGSRRSRRVRAPRRASPTTVLASLSRCSWTSRTANSRSITHSAFHDSRAPGAGRGRGRAGRRTSTGDRPVQVAFVVVQLKVEVQPDGPHLLT